ncbi:MAG: class I SAM-dependent methyltransferase, partial [Chloroflexi bacterium]
MLGAEYSASGVTISREKLPSATFLQRDLLVDEPPPAEYASWANRAVCSEVLEHVDDPLRLLRNAFRFCAPGCRLVVTVPGGPMSAFDHYIGHRKHYTTGSLRRLLEEAGLLIDRVAAMGFPVFNLYRLAVIARGDRLIQEIASGGTRRVSAPARLAMGTFRGLF